MNKRQKPMQQKQLPEELQAFADLRQRAAVFFMLPQEPIDLEHVLRLQDAIDDKRFDELDFVIHSGGGNVDASFQIIQLLRSRTKRLNACVPIYAKSAATLLCIAADSIVLDELAQLGPLDTQVEELKKGGQREFTSALNPFKALEQLRKFSMETLDLAVKMIVNRSNMNLDDCIKHGMDFVRVTTSPLYSQMDPEKLGEYSRALSIGKEYGERLLKRHSKWDEDKISEVLQKLVYDYPSHEYIIDYFELKEMEFNVELFNNEERKIVKRLVRQLHKIDSIIKLIEPTNIRVEQNVKLQEKENI